MKEYNVFVSYSRKDDINYLSDTGMPSPVDLIIKRFKEEGIKHWIDRDGNYYGAPFVEEITNALSNSELVLFISSKNSNDDGPDESGNIKAKWIRREIIEADDNNIKIIPLRIDETPYNSKIKMIFKGIDSIDYYKDPKKGLDDMVGSIKLHLSIIKEEEKKRAEAKEAERRRLEEEKERERKEAEEKEKIEKLEKDIKNIKNRIIDYVDKQQAWMKELLSKEKELNRSNDENKECPICHTLFSDLETDYCDICGWHFAIPKELTSPTMQQMYEDRLQISQTTWKEKLQNKEIIVALKKENINYKTHLKKLQEEFDDWKNKNKIKLEDNKKQFQAKLDEISIIEKKLNNTKSQLSKVQQKFSELSKTKPEKHVFNNSNMGKQPIAFLLVTEFDQMNVYCLYEGHNFFGAMEATPNLSDYQMIVVSDNNLNPQHFEINVRRKDKHFAFTVSPINETCALALNSQANLVKGENSIQINDMLFIGDVKIQIIDNFNKSI